jgi:ribosomal-protein-serine acetyltransferase
MKVDRLPETMPSPRLTLRRWVADDVELLAAAIAANVDHLRPWMPWASAEPMALVDRIALINQWQAEWERGGDVVIAAFLDGEVVGSTGLHRRRGPGILEVGYWVHRDHLRKGFATEMAAALTSAAFTVPGIEHVEIHHDKANAASGGVPRMLGFTYVDESPNAITSPGEVGIDCRWTMTRSEWMAKGVGPC